MAFFKGMQARFFLKSIWCTSTELGWTSYYPPQTWRILARIFYRKLLESDAILWNICQKPSYAQTFTQDNCVLMSWRKRWQIFSWITTRKQIQHNKGNLTTGSVTQNSFYKALLKQDLCLCCSYMYSLTQNNKKFKFYREKWPVSTSSLKQEGWSKEQQEIYLESFSPSKTWYLLIMAAS